MNTITVKKDELLDTLRTNRQRHGDKVAQARAKYREKIIEELDRRLAEAKSGRDIDPGFLHRLPIPRDYSQEYDRAVEQLEWEVGETVELDPDDFNRYVRDEWEWHNQFVGSTQVYLTS
jgi:predicted phage-related endonuclease